MASAGLEAGVVVSRDVEALPARGAGAMPRVVVGVIAACSMLGLVAWSCGALESGAAAPLRPTPLLAFVPAGMVPEKGHHKGGKTLWYSTKTYGVRRAEWLAKRHLRKPRTTEGRPHLLQEPEEDVPDESF